MLFPYVHCLVVIDEVLEEFRACLLCKNMLNTWPPTWSKGGTENTIVILLVLRDVCLAINFLNSV
ncbi:hypothetical protein LguiA_027822 [Lonicera macranthoides]